jgi:23S rRNA pseudouridine1911/1915/1917 synthase
MDEVVPEALAGERVDRVVAMVTGASRSEAARWVTEGRVLVDDAVVTARSQRVEAGQTITAPEPDRTPEHVTPDPSVAVDVIHEDADVIVVDKPAGLVVHPGAGHREGTLVQGLLARHPEVAAVGDPARPGIVHRIDRGTSGLLVVARSSRAYEDLVRQLAARSVERRYLALVWGHPADPAGVVDAPIGRSVRRPTRMTVSESGREARTRYEVERAFAEPVEVALLSCRLETGRTHQIRVHLAAIGHPVVGDDAYGGVRPGLAVERPLLHAAVLGFTHPASGEPLRFEVPVPDDFAAVVSTLRA